MTSLSFKCEVRAISAISSGDSAVFLATAEMNCVYKKSVPLDNESLTLLIT